MSNYRECLPDLYEVLQPFANEGEKLTEDTQLVADGDYVIIAYQDSTSHELRLASSQGQGQNWTFEVLAGDEDPFTGAYGFYTDVVVDGGDAYISSYVVNEHAEPDLLGNRAVKFFVEIFRRNLRPE